MHDAARRGRTEVIKYLIENGADADAKNNLGETAVDFARTAKHEDVVELIRKYE